MVKAYRAAVIGSGPNGLAAAAVLAQAGVKVTVYESQIAPGGACRSGELLESGVMSDFGAAAHPLGVVSPVFKKLSLEQHGLVWLHPDVVFAHPFEEGEAGLVYRDLYRTANYRGRDENAWVALHGGVLKRWPSVVDTVLGPLIRLPRHPGALGAFGIRAIAPAKMTATALFREQSSRALFAGSAAHSFLPPNHIFTSAFGVLFGTAAQSTGWPVALGGSQAIVDALVNAVTSLGGKIITDCKVQSLKMVQPAEIIILDMTPRQILAMEGLHLSSRYQHALQRWRYGTSIYKVDLLLDGPPPWRDRRVASAGTVHVGGTLEEIQQAEYEARVGVLPRRPFVMVAQPSSIDPSRAPKGKFVMWAYAHIPHGCADPAAGENIMSQLERYAPGIRDRVLIRRDTTPAELESWNSNLVGGTIGGGSLDGMQQIFRPAIQQNPYSTGVPGVWVASSATPPGGGVHGMAGYHAATCALAELGSPYGII